MHRCISWLRTNWIEVSHTNAADEVLDLGFLTLIYATLRLTVKSHTPVVYQLPPLPKCCYGGPHSHLCSLRQPGLPAEDSDGLSWISAMHIPPSPGCHWFIWAQPVHSVTPWVCVCVHICASLSVWVHVPCAPLHEKKVSMICFFKNLLQTHTETHMWCWLWFVANAHIHTHTC